MIQQMKSLARTVAPTPVRGAWGQVYGNVKIRRARQVFSGVNPTLPAEYLPAALLPELMSRGYRPPAAIRYDADGLSERAAEKIVRLRAQVPLDALSTCVELGCWDGMVLAELRRSGHQAFGVDLSRDGFDPRAHEAGVRLVQTNAATLAFKSASIDLVYSFAAFEHFSDPASVLADAARTLRRGGYLYLFFGPVYTSPYGLHAYRQIPIPYCHYLFADDDLRSFATTTFGAVRWPYVNGVSVTDYRRLFADTSVPLERLRYHEHPTGGVGAELIAAYPRCFRGRVPGFDDLLVSAIEVCFRKR